MAWLLSKFLKLTPLEEFGTYEIFTEVFSSRRITSDKLVPMITALTARGYGLHELVDLYLMTFIPNHNHEGI